jgi:hypothetical protein
VLKHAGAAEDGTGRMTFLATISGLAAEQLPAALEAYLGRRTAAAERGGVAPGFGETEGFSFLSRVVHERRLAAEVTSEAEIGEHAFFDPDPEGSLCYRPAVSNRLGDRFRLTPELDRILTGAGADADIAAGWLELLAANGLARSGSLVVAREADD